MHLSITIKSGFASPASPISNALASPKPFHYSFPNANLEPTANSQQPTANSQQPYALRASRLPLIASPLRACHPRQGLANYFSS